MSCSGVDDVVVGVGSVGVCIIVDDVVVGGE